MRRICSINGELGGSIFGIAAVAAFVLLSGCPGQSNTQTGDEPAISSDAKPEETVLSYNEIRATLADDYVIGADGKFINPVVEDKFTQFREIPMFRGCTYGLASYNAPFGIGSPPETLSDNGSEEAGQPIDDTMDKPAGIEDVAAIDIQMSSYLGRMGIPARLFEGPIKTWVAASLSGDPQATAPVALQFDYGRDGETSIYETQVPRLDAELITAINANIAKAGLQNIVRLEPTEGCGAGDVPYRIQTSPAQSVVSVIQTTYFKLCKVRKIDPYDQSKCNGWKDLRDGQLAYMAGDYQWSMETKGSGQKRGKLSLFGDEIAEEIPLKIGD